jgi:hypothetical protein
MHTGRGSGNSTPAGKMRESSVVSQLLYNDSSNPRGKNGNMTDCKHGQEHLTKRTREGSPEDEKERYKT